MDSEKLSTYLEALHWRYATKQFDSNFALDEKVLNGILEAARLAPSSYGLQPCHYHVIFNTEVRAKLRGFAFNQPQVTDASALIVLCTIPELTANDINSYVQDIASTRKIDPSVIEGYKQMMLGSLPMMQGEAGRNWTAKQLYLAMGMLLSACALAEIDACPMEGFDKAKFDEILDLPSKNLSAQLVCAIGKRSASDTLASATKVRKPFASVVSFVR